MTRVVNRSNSVSADSLPVVLVHGWGGSFESTWKGSGFVDLLHDLGRTVVGVDLLGHGDAPKPHDPAAYSDLTLAIDDALTARGLTGPIDAVGFSLGAMTVLRYAILHPGRVRNLVLAGVGRNVLETSGDDEIERIVAALEGRGDPNDNVARLFVQYAERPGNDRIALTCVMKRPRDPFDADQLRSVTSRTLVVIGDQDFAGPGEPLVATIPGANLRTLRNVDHFATTENFGFFDAALDFLANGSP